MELKCINIKYLVINIYLLGFQVGLPMTDGLPDSHIAHSPAKSIEKLLKLPVERDK